MMFVPVTEDILTYTAVITGRHRVVILKVHNRRQTSTQHYTVKTAGQQDSCYSFGFPGVLMGFQNISAPIVSCYFQQLLQSAHMLSAIQSFLFVNYRTIYPQKHQHKLQISNSFLNLKH